MSIAAFSRPDDNILSGATVGGTAPSTTYDLETLLRNDPARRVRFDSGTVTIDFALASALRGDFLFIPVSNLDAGASVLTLTNDDGLSEAITVPARPPHRIPAGIVADLRGVSEADRTSDGWHLVISGNSVDVVLGGCVWIGQLRTLERNFSWGNAPQSRFNQAATQNDYGVDYVVNHRTVNETYPVTFDAATDADGAALLAWAQATWGGALASVFWPDPAVADALLVRVPPQFEQTLQFLDWRSVAFTFPVLSKGKPV